MLVNKFEHLNKRTLIFQTTALANIAFFTSCWKRKKLQNISYKAVPSLVHFSSPAALITLVGSPVGDCKNRGIHLANYSNHSKTKQTSKMRISLSTHVSTCILAQLASHTHTHTIQHTHTHTIHSVTKHNTTILYYIILCLPIHGGGGSFQLF